MYSGGVTRDWAGVPRKLFTPGSGQSRCVCIKDETSATSDDDEKRVQLQPESEPNPKLRLYENCDPRAVSCQI